MQSKGRGREERPLGALTGSLRVIFGAMGVLEDFRGGGVDAGQSDEHF